MRLQGAAAILYHDDEFVLVKHNEKSKHPTGVYSLPGGEHEDLDKDNLDTIVREVDEETGLKLKRSDFEYEDHFDFELGGKTGNRKVSVDLYSSRTKNRTNLKAYNETDPEWVKMNDYLSGKYPITYASRNFEVGVRNLLEKLLNK